MRHVHIIRLVTLACLLISLGALLAVGRVGSADAHPLSTTAVLLTVADDEVTGEIQLPIDRLAIAVGHDLDAASVLQRAELERLRTYVSDHVSARSANGGDWAVVVAGGTVADIDDVDHLVYTLTMAPATGVVTDFTLHYDAIVEELVSHRIFVSERTAGATAYTSLGGLSWSQKSLRVPAGGASASTGFGSSVRLGIDHISGGADHLMFLLMLLLPAPLIASRARWVRSADTKRSWWRVVHVVTAFAIGHSITLALASFGLVEVPTRFVESMIALSILVSGVHAIRPLVPGGESWIAGGFGLMHGLAFAALIDDLGLGRGSLVANLLGFN
ncbi:MAG: HupE/UreJ family protein, partial [Thermoleophilia bacterium]|nr:HupE/UreJ family protein [Thermoleophilia bacterium]